MAHALPTQMRALVLHSYDNHFADLAVEQRPVQPPGPNQVVVKMAYAPCNPSDLMFLQGQYAFQKPLPTVPGIEGSGVVVAAGRGLMAHWLMGKRVACAAGDGDGTWAEYLTTSAAQCIPLPPQINDEQGAMALVNPMTAVALLDTARGKGARTIVQTAAASQLGRMINRLAPRFHIEVINIVRREEQVKLLQAHGAKYALNSSNPDFVASLKAACRERNARIAFDAVGGEFTGILLAALPSRGRVIVYGALEQAAIQAHPRDIIFRDTSVTGFYLTHWLARKGPIGMLRLVSQLRAMSRDVQSEIHMRVPLADAQEALHAYERAMSAGKILFSLREPA